MTKRNICWHWKRENPPYWCRKKLVECLRAWSRRTNSAEVLACAVRSWLSWLTFDQSKGECSLQN